MSFRLIQIILILCCTTLNANKVSSIYENWIVSFDSFESGMQAIDELRNRILADISNAEDRLHQIHQFVVETPVEQRTEPGLVFMGIWHELASPEERGKFISDVVAKSSNPVELRISKTYLKADLIDKNRAKKSFPDDHELIENYYDASHYASEEIILTTRLAALLFSIAPEASLRDIAEVSNDERMRKLLQRAQSIRFKLLKFRDEEPWNELQSILAQLAQNDALAVRAYLARVVAWGRQLFPRLDFSDQILEKINSDESQLVNYLLSSNKPEDLLGISGDKISGIERCKIVQQSRNHIDIQTITTNQIKKSQINRAINKTGEESLSEPTQKPSENSKSCHWWLWLTGTAVLCGIALILQRKSNGRRE